MLVVGGIILAFVIVDLWTDPQIAETVVAAEAGAVSQIVRDAAVTSQAVDDLYQVLAAYEPRSFSKQSFYQKALNELPELLQMLICGGAAVIILITLL
ncbi:hypothetical protein [Streptomyces sp. IMTB 1903]|uniref:hypothetical protein n=1 Tax=Streptomyces sp. IMTB 1903 TaxID=1776680 RepID=UPI00075BF122|nr:hypothetical protein [Streptomyces sp. IMTB 1903]